MAKFPRLRKALELENAQECVEWKRAIMTTGDNQAEKITRWLTPLMAGKFKAGAIDLEAAQKSAIKRIEVDFAKRLARSIAKIDAAENAGELLSIDISVEWKKNRTWGNNPMAIVRAWAGEYKIECGTGTASGCGYDKESAAIAGALNSCHSVMAALYEVAESLAGRQDEYREKIGYGSGYSILPYFEGGVGVSCYSRIFEAMGYIMKHTAWGNTFDVYTVSKKEGGK